MPRLTPIRAVLLLAFMLAGCDSRTAEYPAGTPEQTLDSAAAMVADGNADRLVELVYAEDEHMRSLLNQVGLLLGSMQALADAVQKRFPEELEALRNKTEREGAGPILARLVASGRSSTNREFGVSQIDRTGLTLDTGKAGRKRKARPPQMSQSQRELVNSLLRQLLADPYRWLEQGRSRLTTSRITDDTVAILWDERAILPPFGLVLIQRENRWWLVPPTRFPGVRKVMPRTEDEWFVWGSMVKTIRNVVEDLRKDVDAGRVRNLTDLADTAIEKAAIPSMLIFFAYSNLVEQREQEQSARTGAKNNAPDPPPVKP